MLLLLLACATDASEPAIEVCGTPLYLDPLPTDGSSPRPDWTLPSDDGPEAPYPAVTPVEVPEVVVVEGDWGSDVKTASDVLCRAEIEADRGRLEAWGTPAWLPDLDGDGLAELGMGRASWVGPDQEWFSLAWSSQGWPPSDRDEYDFQCLSWGDSSGPMVDVGPLGGDGPEVVCGSDRLFLQPVSAFADGRAGDDEAFAEIVGPLYLLRVIPLGADFDGDGVAELAVTDPYADDAAWLFDGAAVGAGVHDVADADVALTGPLPLVALDVLGSGVPQIVASARGHSDDRYAADELGVYAVDGAAWSLGEPLSTFTLPTKTATWVGVASLGDGDGDGLDELLLSSTEAAWRFPGSEAASPGVHRQADADLLLFAPGGATVLDLGGDPLPDVLTASTGTVEDPVVAVFFDLAGR